MKLISDKWGYECPKCETTHELSRMLMDERGIVNGKKQIPTSSLKEGDTLTCQECGNESEI